MFEKTFAARHFIDDKLKETDTVCDVILEAMDADTIKTYVGLGLGLGIVPDMTFDASLDKSLHGKSLGHLFGRHQAFVAFKKNVYLHRYMNVFIDMLCGPDSPHTKQK
jgi:LysR family cys regulon transcriptional activator